MNIPCAKCGHENAMGAIFCRSCGAKLETGGVSPDKLHKENSKEKASGNRKKILRDVLCWGALIVIVGGLAWSMFYLDGLKEFALPKDVDSDRLEARWERMTGEVPPQGSSTMKFSPDEINYLLEMKLVPILEGGLEVQHVMLESTDDGQSVYVFAKLFGLDTIFRADGRMTFNEKSSSRPIAFKVNDLTIGRLPVLFMQDYFLEKLAPILENGLVSKAFKHAKSAEFSPEGLRIKMKSPPPPPPAESASSASDSSSAAPSGSQDPRLRAEKERNKKRFQKKKEAPKIPSNTGFKLLERDKYFE